LWHYFEKVIAWVRKIFVNYRREMATVDWGYLFNNYSHLELDPDEIEKRVKELMQDEDVTKKSGIYTYLLNGDERNLSIRSFNATMKREAYERQDGICPKCGLPFEIEKMEGDHIKLWSEGGKTISNNCQMLCKDCHREKSRKL